MEKIYGSETGCCKKFDPKPWNEKQIKWKNKLFLKDHIVSFFHIPLNFGQVMLKNMDKITKAKALAPQPILLSDEKSLFGADIYIAVSKKVPNSEMVRMSGAFLTKVFEGDYKNIGKWVSEMHAFVASKKRKVKKLYFFYTTCPACAKHYGKNYVVLVAEV
ncbi:hypothetical protein HZC09_05905 [Candidatus Micrarchaeota archaeon]|nr:hypothetical protein [Candidatus Micrarchaeota archaeon]